MDASFQFLPAKSWMLTPAQCFEHFGGLSGSLGNTMFLDEEPGNFVVKNRAYSKAQGWAV